jgi:hypothetical protein
MASLLNPSPSSPPLRYVAATVALWIVGGTAIGIGAALLNPGHDSVIFATLGIATGISGAVAHAVLLFSARFRNQPRVVQVFALWLATMLSFLVLVALAVWPSTDPVIQPLYEMVLSVGQYVAVPALFVAGLLNHLVGRGGAA